MEGAYQQLLNKNRIGFRLKITSELVAFWWRSDTMTLCLHRINGYYEIDIKTKGTNGFDYHRNEHWRGYMYLLESVKNDRKRLYDEISTIIDHIKLLFVDVGLYMAHVHRANLTNYIEMGNPPNRRRIADPGPFVIRNHIEPVWIQQMELYPVDICCEYISEFNRNDVTDVDKCILDDIESHVNAIKSYILDIDADLHGETSETSEMNAYFMYLNSLIYRAKSARSVYSA